VGSLACADFPMPRLSQTSKLAYNKADRLEISWYCGPSTRTPLDQGRGKMSFGKTHRRPSCFLIHGGILAAIFFAVSSHSIAAEPVVAVMKTSMGDIRLELDTEKAPITVGNFVEYAKSGHFSGTVFHRVIKGFMIQGGGFNAQLKEKETRKPIRNESTNGLRNKKYSIAMARTSDPDSASSQFFINTTDNSMLDRDRARDGVGYAVFGRVVSGQEVVDAIESVATRTLGPLENVPVKPIVIESVTILEASK
jgi:cyclophilin family peptidyl-prolyl cis-trans isomerase